MKRGLPATHSIYMITMRHIFGLFVIGTLLLQSSHVCLRANSSAVLCKHKGEFYRSIPQEWSESYASHDLSSEKLIKLAQLYPQERWRIAVAMGVVAANGGLADISSQVAKDILSLDSILTDPISLRHFAARIVPNLNLPVHIRTRFLWNKIVDTEGNDLSYALALLEMGAVIEIDDDFQHIKEVCDDEVTLYVALRMLRRN